MRAVKSSIGAPRSAKPGRASPHERFDPYRRRIVCASMVAVAAAVPLALAWAESIETAKRPAHGPLDGLAFDARIVRGPGGEPRDDALIDELTFADGHFTSAICTRYGFTPTLYWVRSTDDGTAFRAEMTSPTDGTMVWEGTVSGDALEGTMRWTKRRWYWTIAVTHDVRGERTNASVPDAAAAR